MLKEQGSQVMREREVSMIFWGNEEGGAGINQQRGVRRRETENQKPALLKSRWLSKGQNWMLHMTCNEI